MSDEGDYDKGFYFKRFVFQMSQDVLCQMQSL